MTVSTKQQPKEDVQIYPPTLTDFCHFINKYLELLEDPQTIALVCEQQAEAVRITQQDVTPETLDLMLDTMLNILHHMGKQWAEAQEQKQWTTRLKTLIRRRKHSKQINNPIPNSR